jgi:hypothetical protein
MVVMARSGGGAGGWLVLVSLAVRSLLECHYFIF